MADLNACLYNRDMAFLRGVASHWGLEISGKDARSYSLKLEDAILTSGIIREVIESLPKAAHKALQALRVAEGVLPWTTFTRQFGELRPMGPAKQEREKPGIFPASITELLWYRGLIGRIFYQTADGHLEMAFLPEEFMHAVKVDPDDTKETQNSLPTVLNQMVVLVEAGSDKVLDELCVLLSALRRPDRGGLLKRMPFEHAELLVRLAEAIGLIDPKTSQPAVLAKGFLEQPRAQALPWLVENWRKSTKFNELRLIPEFRCEGTWTNNSLKPRRFVLELINQIEANEWFSLDVFIEHIASSHPDFLRQGAAYDNWIIASNSPDGGLLRGTASWPAVEGVYLRFLLLGPMRWLGLLDEGRAAHGGETVFLRPSHLFDALINQFALPDLEEEKEKIAVSSSGVLEMSHRAPRIARYQLSRFGEWLDFSMKRYSYRLTPASLKEARSQGLLTRHLLALLRKYGKSNPALTQAISRWEEKGQEAWLDRPLVLHLGDAELLKSLRDSPANKFLGAALGPATVVVKPGGEKRVQDELGRLGILTDGVASKDA